MDLEDYLRQFRWSDPDPELKPRILDAAASPPLLAKRRWPWVFGAAAAVLLATGIGYWALREMLARDPGNGPSYAGKPSEGEGELAPVMILGGRGRVLPVEPETRFTVLDSERGRIRLERGQVYVELEAGTGEGAEVQTPAGTARALGTRFYAHYFSAAHSLLAVAVLGGKVEVDNPHGRTTCAAGEVAVADAASAPHKQMDGHAGHHHGFCPFVSSLGLVYRPEVQAELRLTGEQKAQLQRPGLDERREICRFFRSLHGQPRAEWATKAQEFTTQLERRTAEALSAVQKKRLKQIAYQQESYFALLRTEAGSELPITPEQRQGIDRILADFTRIRRGLLDGKLPAEERSVKIAAAWKTAIGQAEAVLTADQKERWNELAGPPVGLPPQF